MKQEKKRKLNFSYLSYIKIERRDLNKEFQNFL